jgi:hypothetical protein
LVVAGQVEGGTAATLFLDFGDLAAMRGAVVRSREAKAAQLSQSTRAVLVGFSDCTHAQWMRDGEIVTFITAVGSGERLQI